MKQRLKRALLPAGRRPYAIRGGLLRGLRMNLDLAHQSQLWLGLDERELLPCFRDLSAGIASAVDVGAAQGIYTLFFLTRTMAGRVLALEPAGADGIFQNLQLNGLRADPRVQVLEKFAADREDELHVTLDSIGGALPGPRLVKVDVEGAEASVLRGACRLLDEPDTRWIIEVHSAALLSECRRILEARGYGVKVIPNAWWRFLLPERRPIEVNQWLAAVKGSHPENAPSIRKG